MIRVLLIGPDADRMAAELRQAAPAADIVSARLPASAIRSFEQTPSDVVVLCGFRIPWETDWTAELGSFVADHGKGLLISMEYEGLAQPTDFENASALLAPTGIQFNPLNLEWAPADTSIELDCVPDLPPIE